MKKFYCNNLILGGECDENFDCVKCYSGESAISNQYGFRYGQCKCKVSLCLACKSYSDCFVCYNSLPLPNSKNPGEIKCQTMKELRCPTGFGFANAFKHNCTQCPQGCKSCDYSTDPGGCTECEDPQHKAVEYSQSNYYKEGHPKHGVAECLDLTNKIKGFFTDSSTNYKKCLSGCRQCSDATNALSVKTQMIQQV